MAHSGGVADAVSIVAVGHADMQVHVQCFLGGAAQGLQVAVRAGLKGHLAAGEARHPQAACS